MKKAGIINAELAAAIASLRHLETFVVSDSGLPATGEPPVIDLGVIYGVPPFETVLRAILDEVVVDGALIARETELRNVAVSQLVRELVRDVEFVSHDELKARVASAAFVVRTGEATPYANVILRAGVPF